MRLFKSDYTKPFRTKLLNQEERSALLKSIGGKKDVLFNTSQV